MVQYVRVQWLFHGHRAKNNEKVWQERLLGFCGAQSMAAEKRRRYAFDRM